MDAFNHPAFPEGARVALVRQLQDPRYFGVAMKGGRFVCKLPLGYDGQTSVRWINGFIVVAHPKLPPLLADTTVRGGKTEPLSKEQFERMKADIARSLNLARGTRILH